MVRSSHHHSIFLQRIVIAASFGMSRSVVAADHRFASVTAADLSPVTRVVDLLKALSARIEKEGIAEEHLYSKFVCWGKTTIDAKTATNAAALSRIGSLNTYISDIEAGRIEFTTERVDLEKEISQLNADLEEALSLRGQENSDFQEAKREMQQGIAALSDAIRVLQEATSTGSLLAMKTARHQAAQGFAARSAEAAALAHAADLGARILSKGDARFLRRLLTGEVPTWDWKKINRKAKFKMTYKARSANIQTVLAKLLQTFQTNLAEATKKEAEAQAIFDRLEQAKTAQRTASESALAQLVQENGARGLTKQQAADEVVDLQNQVADDTKYIQQVQQSLDTKKSEWDVRSKLRSDELEAISKAIAVLHSDDARDLFKKSLQSQGYSFLELHIAGSDQGRSVAAAAVLRQAVVSANHDARLAALAARVVASARGNFEAVIQAIDTMVGLLSDEESTELSTKETCEGDRAADTRSAAVESRAADELTDRKDRLETEIEEIKSEISDKKKQIDGIAAQLQDARRIRDDEAKAFATAKADDEDAIALVGVARNILQKFYSDNGLMLLAEKRRQPSVVEAGLAPLPPPATWETTYGGKADDSTGIIAILAMIEDDMKKDLAKATEEEANAIRDYTSMKEAQDQQILDVQGAISLLEGTQSQKETEVGEAMTQRTSKVAGLKVIMERIRTAQPGCDYVLVNFPTRSNNRQIEIDGLHKAKAILQGAVFPSAGGALVQRPRRQQFLASLRPQ